MPAADTKTMARTVLLADDSPTIQRVVELSFAGEDVTLVTVGDGGAAIDAIRRSPPDVVLADVAMPGGSGYDVLQFVRSQPSLAGLPVLLLTGAFEPLDDARIGSLGAAGVLTKPFDPAALVARVNDLLARRDVDRRTPTPQAATQTVPQTPTSSLLPAVAVSKSERDRYFEEIDEAFAAMSQSPRPLLPRASDDEPLPDSAAAAARAETTRAASVDASPASSGAEDDSVPLTDAFAALLEAEQTGVPLDTLWRRPSAPLEPVDVERLADLVARRVLEQLTDRVVRDTVSQIVSATAERLVREEIERIKRHIK